jgi:hypothetical protein
MDARPNSSTGTVKLQDYSPLLVRGRPTGRRPLLHADAVAVQWMHSGGQDSLIMILLAHGLVVVVRESQNQKKKRHFAS